MRAVGYDRTGRLGEVDLPAPVPERGEVRVAVAVSGVNPADWKNRRRYSGADLVVPNHDGAGVVDAVGPGGDGTRVGERVWLRAVGRQRCGGTAQELTIVPDAMAVTLPDEASMDLGASLGVPAVTAHRCLTVADAGPARLGPGALDGRTVLVAGGAGAVGHAAIQLARWSGATVIATVSSPEKAALAIAAGAHHTVDYRTADGAPMVRELSAGGVDVVVELAPQDNLELDLAVLAPSGTVAIYAGSSAPMSVPLFDSMMRNLRWQFVSIFTMPPAADAEAAQAIAAGVIAGALPIGRAAGLPIHRLPLARSQDAHDAVEAGTIGKVLIDVSPHLV